MKCGSKKKKWPQNNCVPKKTGISYPSFGKQWEHFQAPLLPPRFFVDARPRATRADCPVYRTVPARRTHWQATDPAGRFRECAAIPNQARFPPARRRGSSPAAPPNSHAERERVKFQPWLARPTFAGQLDQREFAGSSISPARSGFNSTQRQQASRYSWSWMGLDSYRHPHSVRFVAC